MEIIVAEFAGFCEGVERAYHIALKQAKAGRPVFMLGNLVHNSQVVEKLTASGIKIIKKLSDIQQFNNGLLLISAHGVPPQVYAEAKEKRLEVIDTTCPWVKKAQHLAKELSDKGLKVVIIGDKDHPEVKGLLGWAGENSLVVESPKDLTETLSRIAPNEKIGMIAQTTQSEQNFNEIVEILQSKFSDLIVHKTICGATSKRQNSAVELAKKVDLMLVIGDKMSANTKRLAELCINSGAETHQIQTVNELENKWIIGKEKIGITAGASTPEWVIDEIIALLRVQ